MDWFRMYSDMPHDPKVGTLTDSQFRTWVELLCLAGKEGNCGSIGVDIEAAAWSLRRDIVDDVVELRKRGLVEIGDGMIYIIKWAKRQFKSDHDGADRVRRHREKDCNVTVTTDGRNCNPPEQIITEQIQNRSDTEKPLSRARLSFDEVREIYRHVYRDQLPSPFICQQLEHVAENYTADEIKDAFTAAESKKATSFNYITKRLEKIAAARKADDAMWEGMGQ